VRVSRCTGSATMLALVAATKNSMRTIKGRFGKHGVIQTQGQTLSD